MGARHDVGDLANAGNLAGGGLLASDRHACRVLEVKCGDGGYARGDCGREERGLLVGRGRFEDRLHVVGEAHVEHLVGLVEGQHANLIELQGAAVDVVEDAARCAHDDVGAATQRAGLHFQRCSAVDGNDAEARAPRVLVDRFRDLHGELAGGHEDEAVGAAARAAAADDPLQHRQGEGGRLSGAGRRLAQHVAALEQHRDRLALHGRRLFVAEGRGGGHEEFGETEVSERRHSSPHRQGAYIPRGSFQSARRWRSASMARSRFATENTPGGADVEAPHPAARAKPRACALSMSAIFSRNDFSFSTYRYPSVSRGPVGRCP